VIPAKRKRFRAHVGRSFSAAFLIILFLLLSFTFAMPERGEGLPRVVLRAWTPTTIAAASTPARPTNPKPISDWIDALTWMRYNLPQNAVVVSWWDYGYWITNMANKTTLCDNGTVNMTQIALVGRMFMSNETYALETLKKYDAKYVVVFTTFYVGGTQEQPQLLPRGWGDEGKWQWMAKIAGLNYTEFGVWDEQGYWSDWSDKGKTTVLYKLMSYGRDMRLYYQQYQSEPDEATLQSYKAQYYLEHFDLAYFSKGDINISGGIYVLVCVYEVIE